MSTRSLSRAFTTLSDTFKRDDEKRITIITMKIPKQIQSQTYTINTNTSFAAAAITATTITTQYAATSMMLHFDTTTFSMQVFLLTQEKLQMSDILLFFLLGNAFNSNQTAPPYWLQPKIEFNRRISECHCILILTSCANHGNLSAVSTVKM